MTLDDLTLHHMQYACAGAQKPPASQPWATAPTHTCAFSPILNSYLLNVAACERQQERKELLRSKWKLMMMASISTSCTPSVRMDKYTARSTRKWRSNGADDGAGCVERMRERGRGWHQVRNCICSNVQDTLIYFFVFCELRVWVCVCASADVVVVHSTETIANDERAETDMRDPHFVLAARAFNKHPLKAVIMAKRVPTVCCSWVWIAPHDAADFGLKRIDRIHRTFAVNVLAFRCTLVWNGVCAYSLACVLYFSVFSLSLLACAK